MKKILKPGLKNRKPKMNLNCNTILVILQGEPPPPPPHVFPSFCNMLYANYTVHANFPGVTY